VTIRTKALIIIGVSLLCMAGLVYITSRFTFMRGLEEIEARNTSGNVEQVLGAFSYLISDLEADTADWAAWDDTYAFIEDGNDEYIQSNLGDETFITLRLNLMLFVHSSGQLVFGKAFNLENEEETPVPQDLLSHLAGDSPLLSQAGTHSFTSGIILLKECPVIIASQPILTSEDEGPARGTLIFARYLDSVTINDLTQLALFPITVRPVNNLVYGDFKDALASLSQEEPIFVKPLNTQYISGYTLLKDVYGKPAVVLRVDTPRDTYRLGQLTTSYYILSILGLGVLVAGLAMFIIQKQIMSRFTSLIRDINHITTSGDTSTRISMTGRDELSLIAGTINGMLAMLQEDEAELRVREERYRLLADNVTDVIFTTDMNLRFTYVSPSVIRLTGYSVEEAMGQTLAELLTPVSFEIVRKTFAEEQAIEDLQQKELSRSRTLELEVRRKDDSRVWVEAGVSFLRDADGKAVGILGVARDIAERRQARETLQLQYEQERDLRQRLEEEIQKRVEFTRALVHELKTPITPVMAAAELLLEETKDESSLKLVQSIDRSASNLNRRIDELIDLIRGETDMLQLNLESIEVVSLLQDIGNEMIPVALRDGHSLTVDLPYSNPKVLADRDRLRQVVLNLLNNAFKFTPSGGKVTLRAKEDGTNLIVEVQDTGLGINKEDQKRLFDPYYRRVEDRERLSGLGLGLALSKKLVELHGGRIWVESRKGKGSIFGFSLPLEAASRKEGGVNPRGKS